MDGLVKHYKQTGHLFVIFGDDFGFENALYIFYNIDNLIAAVNEKTDDHGYMVKYSTPTEYIQGLKQFQESDKKFSGWPIRHGDMFPYADK